MSEISAPTREAQRAPSPFPPCEGSEKTAIYEAGGRPTPDRKSAGALILDFPAFINLCRLYAAQAMVFWEGSARGQRWLPNTICRRQPPPWPR